VGSSEPSAVAATLRMSGSSVWPFDAPARAALAAALAQLVTSVPAAGVDVLSAVPGVAQQRRRSRRRALLAAGASGEGREAGASEALAGLPTLSSAGRRARALLAGAAQTADVGLQLRASSAEVAAVAQRQLQNVVGDGQLLVRSAAHAPRTVRRCRCALPALERSGTPSARSAPAQAALVQRNRSVTAVSLLSSSLGAPVDPASFPADGFPSMAVSTASSAAGGGGPGLPVAAIAGIAAGAGALALAVRRAQRGRCALRGELGTAASAEWFISLGVWFYPGEQHRSRTSDQQSCACLQPPSVCPPWDT